MTPQHRKFSPRPSLGSRGSMDALSVSWLVFPIAHHEAHTTSPSDNRFNLGLRAWLRGQPERRWTQLERHTCAKQAGFGLITVRAHSQAMLPVPPAPPAASGRSRSGHLGSDLHLRIQVPDSLEGLIAHPLAVVANILGQPSVASFQTRLSFPSSARVSGLTGGMPGEFRRNLDQCLVDEHRDWVQVAWRMASRPRRWASSGIEPPPANGSWNPGRLVGS